MAEPRKSGQLVSHPQVLRRVGLLVDLVGGVEYDIRDIGERAEPSAIPVTGIPVAIAAGVSLSPRDEFRMRIHPRGERLSYLQAFGDLWIQGAVEAMRKCRGVGRARHETLFGHLFKCSRQNAIVQNVFVRPFFTNRYELIAERILCRNMGRPRA
jgi:hypothetical protein